MNILFTLDQLILLKTIVTHGSFKSAAEALYISQPAVSCQVQKLERQLNVIIFYRKNICNIEKKFHQNWVHIDKFKFQTKSY